MVEDMGISTGINLSAAARRRVVRAARAGQQLPSNVLGPARAHST